MYVLQGGNQGRIKDSPNKGYNPLNFKGMTTNLRIKALKKFIFDFLVSFNPCCATDVNCGVLKAESIYQDSKLLGTVVGREEMKKKWFDNVEVVMTVILELAS